MPKAPPATFDRALDAVVNGAKAADLHAYDVPCYWLVVSPVECQALLAGIVSAEIQKQAARLLKPDLGEEQVFR